MQKKKKIKRKKKPQLPSQISQVEYDCIRPYIHLHQDKIFR